MKYLALGLTMVDEIRKEGEEKNTVFMGGNPIYSYGGLRIWTESCAMVTKAGEDFYKLYNPWFSDNKITEEGIEILKGERTPRCIISYDKGGDLTDTISFETGNWADADRYRPDDGSLIKSVNENTRGICVCGPAEGFEPLKFWDTAFSLRDKYDYKIMWEPNNIHTKPEDKLPTQELLKKVDMASFNLAEGLSIFGLNSEEELIEYLQSFNLELVLLRLGKRGMVAFNKNEKHYIEAFSIGTDVVDTTGCGNASTAAAMQSVCEGDDIALAGIKATVSAAFTYSQKGPIPLFTEELSERALNIAQKYYADYMGDRNG